MLLGRERRSESRIVAEDKRARQREMAWKGVAQKVRGRKVCESCAEGRNKIAPKMTRWRKGQEGAEREDRVEEEIGQKTTRSRGNEKPREREKNSRGKEIARKRETARKRKKIARKRNRAEEKKIAQKRKSRGKESRSRSKIARAIPRAEVCDADSDRTSGSTGMNQRSCYDTMTNPTQG